MSNMWTEMSYDATTDSLNVFPCAHSQDCFGVGLLSPPKKKTSPCATEPSRPPDPGSWQLLLQGPFSGSHRQEPPFNVALDMTSRVITWRLLTRFGTHMICLILKVIALQHIWTPECWHPTLGSTWKSRCKVQGSKTSRRHNIAFHWEASNAECRYFVQTENWMVSIYRYIIYARFLIVCWND